MMADLLFFIRLMGRHASWLILGGLLSLVALAAGIGLLSLAGWFVAAGALGGLAAAGIGVGWLRGLAIGRILARYGERLATHEATFRALAHIRLWFFEQVTPLAPMRLGGLRGGDLLARIIGDIEALDGLYLRILVPSVVALVMALLLTLVVTSVSPAIAITLVLLLALAGIAVPALMARLGAEPSRQQVEISAELRIATVDILQGLAELKAYQAEADHLDRLNRINARLMTTQRRNAWLSGLSAGLTGLLASLAVLAVLTIGSLEAASGALGQIEFAMLTLCAIAAFEAVAPLPLAYQLLGRAKAAAGRLMQVARTAPAVREPDTDKPSPQPLGHAIQLKNVTLQFPGAPRAALDQVSLDLVEGERVALIGPSGSGKSSLIHLLTRFLEADSGHIQIGGVDISALPSDQVREQIGVLSQRTQIFAASLRDNLLIGDAAADDSALADALAQAGLAEFVAGLPEGLETWMGESGVAVSGGQARRIALARVYLKNAPILLLDEPSEGLDEATERDVLQRLTSIMQGRTVLMVTHRPAGLEVMDRVVRLDRGRVVSGSD